MSDFKQGDIVEHKLSREWVMILEVKVPSSPSIYKCRTKSFEIKEFHEFELQEKRK